MVTIERIATSLCTRRSFFFFFRLRVTSFHEDKTVHSSLNSGIVQLNLGKDEVVLYIIPMIYFQPYCLFFCRTMFF